MMSSGLSTFSKLVRICFIEVVGLQVSSFQANLSPKNLLNEPESLQNIAFKKYLERALESEETREMLVDLMLNENLTVEELQFVSEYPVLLEAAMTRIANQQDEQRGPLAIVVSGRRQAFDSPEPVMRHMPLTRTQNVIESGHPLVAERMRNSLQRSGSQEVNHSGRQRPSSSNNEEARRPRPPVEEAVSGRRRKTKQRRNNQQQPAAFQKNSPKSFYNYKNNTKFMHCRL